ncbi:GNAT superfamily N-acetyltransferase [Azospirillum agricola]|uniref:GNAT family N-acetyltransferase n=1 Tax=Azospirillum agricola TaxID=1720247 RepID=UPI001F363405|nr:GNAT family N-acetyltransferase [Azospirillum agricola]MBP2227416.1 GNAT superfamily N-acetyltransferase [Azospirillum agricola]
MGGTDLDAVLAIADVVHPDYPEERAVFAERLALFPDGCRLAEGSDGRALGYGVMHPGLLGVPPPLDAPLGELPAGADCLYLHDIALLPRTRGLGLGASVLEEAHSLAARRGYGWLALTSTPGARSYWDRVGFVPYADASPALAAKLASYGEGMAYMVMAVRT